MIGCYCRVSTNEQSLERQIDATTDYARNRCGADLTNIQVYRDQSTGTDTARSGYREMMADVDAGEIEAVVVNSVSRISRSIRDLDRTAERIADGGSELHILEYCARIELVDDSLPDKVDPPEIPRDARADDTMLHPEDAQALLGYYDADPEARHSRAHALLALAWYTGALRGTDLEDYHPDEQYIQFVHRHDEETPLKNGYDGERAVGLTDEVCAVLDAYIAESRYDTYDEYGRRPLITSQVGRASKNAVRAWMYLATVPCLHSLCPHGNERPSCEYVDYSEASKCPSSRSPHQVRTGSITWHRNRGWPAEELAKKVNSSVRVIEEHYDKPSHLESLEERRRRYTKLLDFDGAEGGGSE